MSVHLDFWKGQWCCPPAREPTERKEELRYQQGHSWFIQGWAAVIVAASLLATISAGALLNAPVCPKPSAQSVVQWQQDLLEVQVTMVKLMHGDNSATVVPELASRASNSTASSEATCSGSNGSSPACQCCRTYINLMIASFFSSLVSLFTGGYGMMMVAVLLMRGVMADVVMVIWTMLSVISLTVAIICLWFGALVGLSLNNPDFVGDFVTRTFPTDVTKFVVMTVLLIVVVPIPWIIWPFATAKPHWYVKWHAWVGRLFCCAHIWANVETRKRASGLYSEEYGHGCCCCGQVLPSLAVQHPVSASSDSQSPRANHQYQHQEMTRF